MTQVHPREKAPKHNRMKPKASKPATLEERVHMERIAALGCCIPGCHHKATVHHETGSPRHARSHKKTVPLCPYHHHYQFNSKTSREAMKLPDFNTHWGVDLEAMADEFWRQSHRNWEAQR